MTMDLFDKLRILADSAKYDVACTSSGVDRSSSEGGRLPYRQRGLLRALPQFRGGWSVHLSFESAYEQCLRL